MNRKQVGEGVLQSGSEKGLEKVHSPSFSPLSSKSQPVDRDPVGSGDVGDPVGMDVGGGRGVGESVINVSTKATSSMAMPPYNLPSAHSA